MKLKIFFLLICTGCYFYSPAQIKQTTYCNPINIDYGYTPIPNFSEWGRHRATAMDSKVPYYFCIEAINENGVSQKTKVIKVDNQ